MKRFIDMLLVKWAAKRIIRLNDEVTECEFSIHEKKNKIQNRKDQIKKLNAMITRLTPYTESYTVKQLKDVANGGRDALEKINYEENVKHKELHGQRSRN